MGNPPGLPHKQLNTGPAPCMQVIFEIILQYAFFSLEINENKTKLIYQIVFKITIRNISLNKYNIPFRMSTLPLLGLLVGAFPTIQSSSIPLSKKLVPAVMVILIMTTVDIMDLGFFVFWSSAEATNWIFLNDIPNRLFNNMMRKIKEKIEAATGSIEDKIADTVLKMINDL